MCITCLCLALAAGVAVAAPFSPCSPPRGYDFPLVRDPMFGYLGNVSMGTPAQELTMFVDWTWTSQYVLSTICNHGAESTAQCLSPGQEIFNQTRSSTFVNETSKYADQAWNPNDFFPAPFEVSYGSDIQKVGPVATRITVQLSDVEDGLLLQVPIQFGGIMGLMPTFPNTPVTQQSSFYQQYHAKAWDAPYVAFGMCDASTKCPAGADAVQTFGGYSTELARKGLMWYPVVPVPTVNALDFSYSPGIFSYWAIELSSLSIGDEAQVFASASADAKAGVPAAIFDHASKGRGLPMDTKAYTRLVEIAGATLIPASSPLLQIPPNNGKQPFYEIDCAATKSLPDISYTFTGSEKKWTVAPEAYVANVAGTCILDVRVLGNGSFQLGNFGDTFLKGKYIVFDYDMLRVGLAEI